MPECLEVLGKHDSHLPSRGDRWEVSTLKLGVLRTRCGAPENVGTMRRKCFLEPWGPLSDVGTRGDPGKKAGRGDQKARRHLGEKYPWGAEGKKCPTQGECEKRRHLQSEAQAGRCPRHTLRAPRDVSATSACIPMGSFLFLQFIYARGVDESAKDV